MGFPWEFGILFSWPFLVPGCNEGRDGGFFVVT